MKNQQPDKPIKQLSKVANEILLVIYRRDLANQKRPDPRPCGDWEHRDYQVERMHGLPWSLRVIGEKLPERVASRYRRAFVQLCDNGLVKPHREHGTQISHARCTKQGFQLAKSLTEQNSNA